MGGRLGDRRTLALLAFSEDSAKTHCRTITHVISVFLLGSSETKVTQNQTKSYKHNAFLFVLGAPAPGSHRTPQGASERCQDASERSHDASGRPRRSRTPQDVGPSPRLLPVLFQCCPNVAPNVAPVLPQCPRDSRETAGRHLGDMHPGNSLETPRKQPGDSRETAGRLQGDSRDITGRQPGDSRETAGRQPGDSRETAGRQPGGAGKHPETHGKHPGEGRETGLAFAVIPAAPKPGRCSQPGQPRPIQTQAQCIPRHHVKSWKPCQSNLIQLNSAA
jgi:hypothetical protein